MGSENGACQGKISGERQIIETKPLTTYSVNKSIIQNLEQIRRIGPELAPGQGWQSGHDLHKSDDLRELASCVNHAVRCVLDFLNIGPADFEITGSWANINPPDAAHRMHNHPNNFLSGVYYVQTKM